MAEPKNPFDFGTGSIDKDQWLRDIDAEQDNFVSRYSNAVNKHRATLIRDAFADLRRRIANGDMLNRTADGQYQFSSALNREDKHMQEAYQRALGFMGDLARRQIQAPPAEPEKKKYSTKTLNDRFIKYFNPSGSQESFTSLWNSYDDAKRLENIKKFLRDELTTGLSNYQDVEDYESLDKLKTTINDFIADPNITNLNRLGFTRNYLNQLKTEEQEEEPKTEEDQVAQDLESQRKQYQLEQNKKALEGLKNASEGTLNFTWTPGNYEDYLNNYFYNTLGYSQNNPYIKAGVQFEQDEKDKDGNVIFRNRPYTTKKQLQQNDKLFDIILNQYANRFKHGYQRDLEDYFSNFGTRYESLYNDNKELLRSNLSKLFATADNKGVTNWENYFTKADDGYVINGSQDDYGNYAILTPQGIIKRNIYKDSYRQSQQQYKEGGVIKGADGFVFDASKYHTKPSSTPTSSEQNSIPKQETSKQSKNQVPQISKADWVRLSSIIPDIISITSAYGGPVGSIISGVSGLTSTVMNAGADFSEGNTAQGWTTLLSGAGADALGLIPGWGTAAKLKKIASTLKATSRVANSIFIGIGAHDALSALNKIIDGKEVTSKDWMDLANGLKMGLQGGLKWGAGSGRVAGKRLQNQAVTHYDIPLADGTKHRATKAEFEEYRKGKGKLTGVAEENILKKPKGKPVVTQEGLKNSREQMLNEYGFFGNITDRGFQNYMDKAGSNGYVYKQWDPSGLNIFKDRQEARKQYLKNLKSNKKSQVPQQPSAPQGNGSDTPIVVPNENANGFYPRIKNGAKLKALRNGGIIKAKWGDDTSDWVTPQYNPESLKQEQQAIYTNPYFPNIKYNGTAPWYKSRFSGESVVNLGNDDSGRADLPGGLTGNNLDYAFARNQAYVKSGQQNKQADIQGYFDQLPSPVDANNLQGLTDIYNKAIDELYLPFTSGKNVPDYLKTDATKHNLLFRQVYGSRAKVNGGDDNYDIGWNPDIIKTFGSASFARRPVNYETKWEDDLKNNLAQAKDRVSKISHNGIEGYVYTDENGRIHPLTNDQLKLINGQQAPQKQNEEKEPSKVTDSVEGIKTVFNTEYKNPNDPTPYIIAGKTALGLYGNKNIYQNLLDEMPQAPLRDPIDRKLAIVGWQEAIKQGQNQLADLRNVTWMQHGADQQVNLAGMHETEGKGRDIMNGQLMKDSGRQFETAGKSWNLDNEDTLYNIGVGDANRRSIADRARMMAQIRAAWRSGDNNILMGAMSDTGNWLLKKYQREQDLVDKVKELSLGNLESYADFALRENPTYKELLAKKQAGTLTEADRAKMLEIKLSIQDKLLKDYANDYYKLYHTPFFGGGHKETIIPINKDGSKLEVAKLKARSKDNDRYVSMMKDLRTTRSRRRRR